MKKDAKYAIYSTPDHVLHYRELHQLLNLDHFHATHLMWCTLYHAINVLAERAIIWVKRVHSSDFESTTISHPFATTLQATQ